MSSHCVLDRLARTGIVTPTKLRDFLTPPIFRTPLPGARSLAMRGESHIWAIRRSTHQTLEDFFINALVSASTCRNHTHQLASNSLKPSFLSMHHKARRKQRPCQTTGPRGFHTGRSTGPVQVQRKPWDVSKRDLKRLVDIDGTAGADTDLSMFLPRNADQQSILYQPQLRKPPSLGDRYPPRPYEPPSLEEVHPFQLHQPTSLEETLPSQPRKPTLLEDANPSPPYEPMIVGVQRPLGKLELLEPPITDSELLIVEDLSALLTDPTQPHSVIYEKYMQLQYPRAARLPFNLLQNVMQHLSIRDTRKRDDVAMQRYMSIMDEMKDTGVQISPFMWNTALSYASRDPGWINKTEAESILSIWKEMEQDAGVQGNAITLTIAFDVATKARNFALADEIWREFETRNLRIDRVARVAQIYGYGLRKDGDKVRSSYMQLVESGEAVDTVVLNCVITALINAGEGPAAEEVFGRMKALATSIGRAVNQRDWRKDRKKRQQQVEAAKSRYSLPGQQNIQDPLGLAPDRHTYRTLVKYHAIQQGNINRAMDLTCEILDAGFALEHSIFSILFRGFGIHGGYSYSEWTASRLESTWQAFLGVTENDPTYWSNMDRWLAKAIVRAFAIRVSRERALEIWEAILEKWEPTPEALDTVNNILKKNYCRGKLRVARFRAYK